MDNYVIGIDGGTNGVRAIIYDLQGEQIAFASRDYELYLPESGWAEQNPEDWWKALVTAVRRAINKAEIDPEQIIGLGADATSCSVVFLDDNYQPLRPSIIWMDVRASREAREISETRHEIRKLNGWGNVSAEWMPCKALWVKNNQPEIYQKSKTVCEYIDWITWKLTGNMTASLNNVSARWFYDNQSGGWPRDFYSKIGLGDLIDKFPDQVLPLGEKVGGLSEKAAAEMGLPAGIPVAEGGADAFVGMLGQNVVRSQKISLITGSSHLLMALSAEERHRQGLWGSYADAVIPGLHMLEGGQTSTGSIVKWFVNNFASGILNENEDHGEIYKTLNERAEKLEPGSAGLILLDHFQGNRTPYTDPDSRGTIWGLSLKHKPEHIYRAILEGISYGTELILEKFREEGIPVSKLVVSGGPTSSKLWMQIHADIAGVPIILPHDPQAPALGSAILGAYAAGAYSSLVEASDNMVHEKEVIEPDRENYKKYRPFYEKYRETYKQIRPLIGDKK